MRFLILTASVAMLVAPMTVGPNLVANGSFEMIDGVRPKGWVWDQRNILNGRLRVFGSSRQPITSKEMLHDYSSRWAVENGIKDLMASYFPDTCPGTEPHHVDVHFLVTTIRRTLYRMIERDPGEKLTNADGTVRTLDRMRNTLVRQGAATLTRDGDDLVVCSTTHTGSTPPTC